MGPRDHLRIHVRNACWVDASAALGLSGQRCARILSSPAVHRKYGGTLHITEVSLMDATMPSLRFFRRFQGFQHVVDCSEHSRVLNRGLDIHKGHVHPFAVASTLYIRPNPIPRSSNTNHHTNKPGPIALHSYLS